MMAPQEWAAFALEFEQSFKGDFGPRHEDDTAGAAQEAAYIGHLAGVTYGEAVAAIALLVHDRQVWLPMPGELLDAVDRVRRAQGSLPAAPPDFAVVWPVVAAAIVLHSTDRDDVAFVAAVGERCGEGAARWVQARGRRALGLEPIDGDHGGAVRHRLEAEYLRFAVAATEDQKVGRAVARAVERGALGPGADGPRTLGGAMAAITETSA